MGIVVFMLNEKPSDLAALLTALAACRAKRRCPCQASSWHGQVGRWPTRVAAARCARTDSTNRADVDGDVVELVEVGLFELVVRLETHTTSARQERGSCMAGTGGLTV